VGIIVSVSFLLSIPQEFIQEVRLPIRCVQKAKAWALGITETEDKAKAIKELIDEHWAHTEAASIVIFRLDIKKPSVR